LQVRKSQLSKTATQHRILALVITVSLLSIYLIHFGVELAWNKATVSLLYSKQSFSNNLHVYGVDHADFQGNPFLEQVAKNFSISWTRTDVFLSSSWSRSVYYTLEQDRYNILGVLGSSTVEPSFGKNWTLADWDRSVSWAVGNYTEIHYWEIWNEPEIKQYQNGFQNGSAYNYFLMLRDAFNIIKSFNSSDIVLSPAVSIWTYGNNINPDTYAWTKELWSYGANNYCDIVSLHVYTLGHMMNDTLPDNLTVRQMLSAGLDKYENLTQKPIWITETGLSTNMTLKEAMFLNQTFTLMTSRPYLKGVFWYDLTDSIDPVDYYGLFNTTSTYNHYPKPALFAFENFLKMPVEENLTLTILPSPFSNKLTSKNYFTISYSSNNRPTTLLFTGQTNSVVISADQNSQVTISGNSSSSNGTEKWCLDSNCLPTTFTVANNANKTFYYYDLLLATISYSILGGGYPLSPSVSYVTAPSMPRNSDTLILVNSSIPKIGNITIWPQRGSILNLTGQLSGSNSTERWELNQPNSSYLLVDHSFEISLQYYNQYYVWILANLTSGGEVSPISDWYNADTSLLISATPNTAYSFISWTGTGTGSYSGSAPDAQITIGGSITEVAHFSLLSSTNSNTSNSSTSVRSYNNSSDTAGSLSNNLTTEPSFQSEKMLDQKTFNAVTYGVSTTVVTFAIGIVAIGVSTRRATSHS
jgi:hypothetical protein